MEHEKGVKDNHNHAATKNGNWHQNVSDQVVYEEIRRQVQITDYARENGFTLLRKGRYYTLAEHDSVRINPELNCYWRNSTLGRNGTAKGDSVIGFAAEFVHDGNLHHALKELSEKVSIPGNMPHKQIAKSRPLARAVKKPALVLPAKGKNMRRAYAYLLKTRYLNQDVVQDFVNRNMLYQDERGNCVFVAYNQKQEPNFACFRGTLSDVRFLGDVPGCDYQKGFYIENRASRLIVTESVIDAMSVMSILKEQGNDYREYDYLAMGGTGKYEAIMEHLKEQKKEQVLLALDRDLSGVESMQQIAKILIQDVGMEEEQVTFHVPGKKDWNQELTEMASHLKPLDQLDFLHNTGLPPIHECAIQSTEQIQEKGFQIREGRHQYRLVELDGEGNFVPVKVAERNLMFFSPREVEGRIPNLYKQIPYLELEAMQAEQRRETLVLKGFFIEDGICMVKVAYQGTETEESIWKQESDVYITTGWEVDGSQEKHLLTEEQEVEFYQYIETNGLSLDESLSILQVKTGGVEPGVMSGESKGSHLDQIQKKEQERKRGMNLESEHQLELVM